MAEYKYKNAIIHIQGEVDKEKLEQATIIFLKKADKCRKLRKKENSNNGDKNSS
jgi:hypothetical protein